MRHFAKAILYGIFLGLALSACVHTASEQAARTYDGVDLAAGDIHARDLSPLKDVSPLSDPPIVVVKDGISRLPIVFKDSSDNRWAAEQLRETIAEMTGVAPELIPEAFDDHVTNAPAFHIGDTQAARKGGYVAPCDHPEAHRVLTREGSVYFLGKADFAVTDWCERELGVRYYWPMRPNEMRPRTEDHLIYGKCVPHTRGLAVHSVEWTDRPVFRHRINSPYENVTWNRWAKGGSSHRGGVNVHAPHAWHKEADAAEHWTIFARSPQDGTRGRTPLLCYGNPETLAYYKYRVQKGIDEHLSDPTAPDSSGGILDYEKKIVTICQWDCNVHCTCDHCVRLYDRRAWGHGSGSPIIWGYFAREFARWMKEAYPDWIVAILPYANTCDVPPDPEDPARSLDLSRYGNVEAMLCTMPGLAMLKNPACKQHEEDLIRQWRKCTGRPVLNWHYSCWPGDYTAAPFIYGKTIQRHYTDMAQDVSGSFVCGSYSVLRLLLSGYVWMRCLYNPDIDVEAVYDGFAARMFGPAAEPMRELIRLQERGWERPWPDDDITSWRNIYGISYPRREVLLMKRLLERARRSIGTDEVFRARLDWYERGFAKFFEESEAYSKGIVHPADAP